MTDKLRKHVENLFSKAPNSKKAVELKEELIQNLTDKYNDLLLEGKTPEAAYNIVIAGIGDVSSLIDDLKKEEHTQFIQNDEQAKKRSAAFVSVAIMLYIISVIPVIILSQFDYEIIGVVFMFLCIAAATGLLIYNGMTKPSYKRKDETIVEEFREWKNTNQDRIKARKTITSTMWSMIVVAYLIVSFLTMRWDVTWILFPIGIVLSNIIKAIFDLTSHS